MYGLGIDQEFGPPASCIARPCLLVTKVNDAHRRACGVVSGTDGSQK